MRKLVGRETRRRQRHNSVTVFRNFADLLAYGGNKGHVSIDWKYIQRLFCVYPYCHLDPLAIALRISRLVALALWISFDCGPPE